MHTAHDIAADTERLWSAESLAAALWEDVYRKRRRRALPHLLVPFDIDRVSPGGAVIDIVQGPKSLASTLTPIGFSDLQLQGSMPSWEQCNSSCNPLGDPVTAEVLNLDDAERLWIRYLRNADRWVGMLDNVDLCYQAACKRSTFLATVIIYLGAKFADWNEGNEHSWSFIDTSAPRSEIPARWKHLKDSLYARARYLAAHAFFNGGRSLETVQAFLLLNLWRETTDSESHLHFGYAARIAMDMRLGDAAPDLDDAMDTVTQRNIARHFRERQKTYLQMLVEDRMQSTLGVTGTTISARAPAVQACASSQSGVAFQPALCAMVTARLLQDRYQQFIEQSNATDVLLHQLQLDLSDWRARHSTEEVHELSSSEESIALYESLIGILQGTVMLHIASAVMKKKFSQSDYETNNTTGRRIDAASLYCIESSERITSAMSQIPPGLVRCVPDSLGLEAAHAARYLCCMLCIYTTADLGPNYLNRAMEMIKKAADIFARAAQHDTDTVSLYATFLDSLPAAAVASSNGIGTRSTDAGLNLAHLHEEAPDLPHTGPLDFGTNFGDNDLFQELFSFLDDDTAGPGL